MRLSTFFPTPEGPPQKFRQILDGPWKIVPTYSRSRGSVDLPALFGWVQEFTDGEVTTTSEVVAGATVGGLPWLSERVSWKVSLIELSELPRYLVTYRAMRIETSGEIIDKPHQGYLPDPPPTVWEPDGDFHAHGWYEIVHLTGAVAYAQLKKPLIGHLQEKVYYPEGFARPSKEGYWTVTWIGEDQPGAIDGSFKVMTSKFQFP